MKWLVSCDPIPGDLTDEVLVAVGGGQGQPAEETLWSYLVQLTSAARAAHSAGLLLRPQSLMPSKVILTSPRRIRVGVHTHPQLH